MNYKRPLPREENFYLADPQELIKRATAAIHQQIVTEFEGLLNDFVKKPKLKKIDQTKLIQVLFVFFYSFLSHSIKRFPL